MLMSRSSTTASDRCLGLLFALALYLPLAAVGLGFDLATPLEETGDPKAPPAWPTRLVEARPAAAALEAWLGERTGLRAFFTRARSLVRLGVLGTDASPSVRLGRQAVAFYEPELAGARAPERGGRLGVDSIAWARWARTWQSQADAVGAHCLFVLFPEKSDVYPELLPPGSAHPESRPAREVLLDLAADLGVDALDLTPALRAARGLDQLYYRGDTHPAPFGYGVAARAVGEHLLARFPGLPLPETDQPAPSWSEEATADLMRMVALEGCFVERSPNTGEHFRNGTRTLARHDRGYRVRGRQPQRASYRGPGPERPRALVLGDSFGYHLGGALAQVFGSLESAHLRGPGQAKGWVERARPDLLVVEAVARVFEAEPARALALASGASTPVAVPARPGSTLGSGLAEGRRAEAMGDATLAPGTGGVLAVEASGPDPQLLIARWPKGRTGRTRVRLEIEPPGPTVLELFVAIGNQPFRSERALRIALAGGNQEVVLSLRYLEDVTALRLDPGILPGTYRIRGPSLEELPRPEPAPLAPRIAPFAPFSPLPGLGFGPCPAS